MTARPRRALTAALAAALLAGSPALARADREADEALARYLDARDLKRLLIDHLEGAMSRASADERSSLTERLATLYADALERAATSEEREALERRAKALLDTFPEAEGFDLRLTLLRAAYARAETTAEGLRLLRVPAQEADEAIRSFKALSTDFAQIGAASNRRVEALEKQEQTAGDLDSALLREAMANARRRRSLAMYLAGWSGVYLAELLSEPGASERPASAGLPAPGAIATEAAKRLGWLLNAPPSAAPTIDRVPEASLRLDHVARAALGVGASASIRGEYEEASRWFDLAERSPDVTPALRDQAFARRLAAAARNDEWIDALRLLRQRRGADTPAGSPANPVTPLAPTEARLVAALAFGADAPGRSAQVVKRLREIALADLVARDELSEALDLTRRFGAEALAGLGDASGFIVAYIRGIEAYERARSAHAGAEGSAAEPGKAEAPTTDRAAAALYEEAASLMKAALGAPDADRFAGARANGAMLRAMAMFYAIEDAPGALRAADQFASAGSLAQGPAERADAGWMRLRALDVGVEHAAKKAKGADAKAGSATSRALAEIESKRDGASSEFLSRHPSDARAGALLLRRSAGLKGDATETIEALLRVSPDAPTHDASRREAVRLLYLAVRDAKPDARSGAVERFARVAEPLLASEATDARAGDAEAGARAVLTARQLLDALLSGPERANDPARARATLETVLALEAGGWASLEACAGEILYRRMQVAAAQSAADELASLAGDLDRLSGAAMADRFVGAARRLLMRAAVTEWRRGPRTEALARALVRHAEAAPVAGEPTDDAGVTALAAGADAAAFLFMEVGDNDAKAVALRLMRAALAARPNDRAILRQAAEFAGAASEPAFGAECWKRLLAGAELGSNAWFEATTGYLTALSHADAARARDLLDRHRALFPEYGPEPWGERLRALDDSTPQAQGGAPAQPGGAR